jgi:hypothetical protein
MWSEVLVYVYAAVAYPNKWVMIPKEDIGLGAVILKNHLSCVNEQNYEILLHCTGLTVCQYALSDHFKRNRVWIMKG